MLRSAVIIAVSLIRIFRCSFRLRFYRRCFFSGLSFFFPGCLYGCFLLHGRFFHRLLLHGRDHRFRLGGRFRRFLLNGYFRFFNRHCGSFFSFSYRSGLRHCSFGFVRSSFLPCLGAFILGLFLFCSLQFCLVFSEAFYNIGCRTFR